MGHMLRFSYLPVYSSKILPTNPWFYHTFKQKFAKKRTNHTPKGKGKLVKLWEEGVRISPLSFPHILLYFNPRYLAVQIGNKINGPWPCLSSSQEGTLQTTSDIYWYLASYSIFLGENNRDMLPKSAINLYVNSNQQHFFFSLLFVCIQAFMVIYL